jgi:hypothetical protein
MIILQREDLENTQHHISRMFNSSFRSLDIFPNKEGGDIVL